MERDPKLGDDHEESITNMETYIKTKYDNEGVELFNIDNLADKNVFNGNINAENKRKREYIDATSESITHSIEPEENEEYFFVKHTNGIQHDTDTQYH